MRRGWFEVCALLLAAMLAICVKSWADPIVTSGFTTTDLPANDDGSSASTAIGFNINFFGTSYSNLFVNNNGNLTFTNSLSTYTPFGLSGVTTPIIAPFFGDVDTRGSGSGLVNYGQGTFSGYSAFVANYPDVGYYAAGTDKLDNFQVILVDRSDTGTGNFDIYFNYGQIQWETGSASFGTDGLGGVSAAVGYSNGLAGASNISYQLPGSLVPGSFIDSGTQPLISSSNDGVPGQFLFQVRNGSVSPVPEPSCLVLLGAGILGLLCMSRFRFTSR